MGLTCSSSNDLLLMHIFTLLLSIAIFSTSSIYQVIGLFTNFSRASILIAISHGTGPCSPLLHPLLPSSPLSTSSTSSPLFSSSLACSWHPALGAPTKTTSCPIASRGLWVVSRGFGGLWSIDVRVPTFNPAISGLFDSESRVCILFCSA